MLRFVLLSSFVLSRKWSRGISYVLALVKAQPRRMIKLYTEHTEFARDKIDRTNVYLTIKLEG